MRKKNKKFNNIYEGNENNYKIDNLKLNTKYEFRICSIYNDLIGDWTEAKEVKTSDFNCDSIILLESKKPREFLKQLYDWTGCSKFELLYRGTKDGTSSNNMHSKCDNQRPIIALCKHERIYFWRIFLS